GAGLVELGVVLLAAAQGQALARLDETVDGDGALLAGRDGVDDELRPGHDVAADEDVGLSGLEGGAVRDGGAAAAGLDLGALQQAAPLDALADGGDDGHGLQRLELALNGDGLAAAGGVRLAQLHEL